MPRRAARVDANHLEICQTLRKFGFSVRSTASVGKDFPDIVAGRDGLNYLIEIKDGAKSPSRTKLSAGQKKFLDEWNGSVVLLKSTEQAEEWANSLRS